MSAKSGHEVLLSVTLSIKYVNYFYLQRKGLIILIIILIICGYCALGEMQNYSSSPPHPPPQLSPQPLFATPHLPMLPVAGGRGILGLSVRCLKIARLHLKNQILLWYLLPLIGK